MADNVAVTQGSGKTVLADEVVDGTLGTGVAQFIKIMDGTLDGTAKATVKAASTLPAATDPALVVTIRDQNANGQATMANSTPVAIASDQSTLPAGGNVAHDSVDSGNPVKQGFKATTALSGLTLVASADRTDGFAGIDGVQIIRPHCNLEDIVTGILANTDGASTSVIAAQGAGIKTYITSVIIANSSATAVTVDLRDGAAGSVKATFPVPASTSGVVCNLPVPLPFSANTAVCMDGSAAATTVTCTLIGFKSKV